MDLRCKKTICKHNKNFACTASKVHIARNTDCLTYDRDFMKTEEKLQDVSRDMFEVAPEISDFVLIAEHIAFLTKWANAMQMELQF